jgi:ribokinase
MPEREVHARRDGPQPVVEDAERPIVVVGAHVQSLFLEVDAIPREGETVMGRHYKETIDGGKATNQAIAAARLGAPVRFVSLVGNDERGLRVRSYLDRYSLDGRWLRFADRPTDVGFVMLPPNGIPAIASADDLAIRLDSGFVAAAGEAFVGAAVVICQLEAPTICAIASFHRAKEVGARTLLNPAPAASLPAELLRLSDVLVPNHHEAAAIVGREAPVAELATALAAIAPWAVVIVTAGGDGAYVCQAGRSVLHLPAPRVPIVDTTGAGDAFVGALAVRLRSGDTVDDAARYAVRAAAISVTRPGTIEAFATAGELATDGTSPRRTLVADA